MKTHRLSKVLKAKVPRKTRAKRATIDGDKALSALRSGCTIDALASSLGVQPRAARLFIDRARRGGHKIKNTGPSTFKLG